MKNFFLSYKTIKWLCILGLIALLLPMLWLSFYSAPAADDFSYGAPAHRAWVETGSVFAVVSAAAGKVWESFFSWQGTFSAIFLMAIQPAVFSEGLYWMTTFIMLAALLCGTFVFCRAFFRGILGMDRQLCDIIAAVLCLISTQLMPSPVQGLYWFNGSVYYVLFYGLMLLGLAVGIRFVNNPESTGKGRLLLLCFIGFFIGGGNYVTALASAVIWAFAEALLLIRKENWKKLLAPGLLLLLGFGLSILAPGNAVRQAIHTTSGGVISSVLQSFKSGLSYSVQWACVPVLGSLAFLGILVWPQLENCGFSFRLPGLVSAFSYCLISAMFCPPIYAMGNVGEPRLLNIIYFAWLLALAINLVYWLGWICKHKKSGAHKGLRLCMVLLACLLLLCGWAIGLLSGTSYTSLLALGTISSGEAQAWHDSALRRFEVLNDESVEDARIEPYPGQPYLLFYSDIVDDPEGWENIDMASFYGKNTVSFNTIS